MARMFFYSSCICTNVLLGFKGQVEIFINKRVSCETIIFDADSRDFAVRPVVEQKVSLRGKAVKS